jgi:hypothetical protein
MVAVTELQRSKPPQKKSTFKIQTFSKNISAVNSFNAQTYFLDLSVQLQAIRTFEVFWPLNLFAMRNTHSQKFSLQAISALSRAKKKFFSLLTRLTVPSPSDFDLMQLEWVT